MEFGEECCLPETDWKDVKILFTSDTSQLESWHSGRITKEIGVDEWFSYTEVEVFVAKTRPQRCITMQCRDGGVMQSVRSIQNLGPPVAPRTFRKLRISMPKSVAWCRKMLAVGLRRLSHTSAFYSNWFFRTGTIFLRCNMDDSIQVLAKKPDRQLPQRISRILEREILPEVWKYLGKFNGLVRLVVGDVVHNLLNIVVEQEYRSGMNCSPMRFEYLPLELQINICTDLDAYERERLKRVSTFFSRLLTLSALERWIILPHLCSSALVDHDYHDQRSLIRCSFLLAHMVSRWVPRQTKRLCLAGNWEKCFYSLGIILHFLNIKLDWLIIADNGGLRFGDFMTFPPNRRMMRLREDHEERSHTVWLSPRSTMKSAAISS
ncbi:uncharacterized protein LOC129595017 [Paramacrobiotus metropolitanus]|uniref:uncharacterized protein LOC129595017 n=1 Tax=Paramacrobiotus metropolitanus TaxID=2943436 RepID=UPI002445A2F0|nr:uncharacterized protein LOC129595017 [Paramacrobiotus metropolitanus]